MVKNKDHSNGKIILETDRLVLREFTLNDVDDLQKILLNPDVMRFSVSGPLDIEGTLIFLKKTIESYTRDGFSKWAIILKENKRLIGCCGLDKITLDNESLIELGYRLAKQFWGKGLGTEAAKLVINYGFENLNLHEIVSCVDKKNISSKRVAEKNGMIFWKDSSFFGHDCMVYKITKKDWAK